MNELFSGLIGAIIGGLIAGYFSYCGAKKSTKNQIEVQMQIYNEQLKRKKQEELDIKEKYTALVQVELISWIELAVERVNKVKKKISRPRQLNHDVNFRNHLNKFISEVNFEEAQLIINLYGMIQKISSSVHTFDYTTGNQNEILHSCEILIEEVLGKENSNYYRDIDPKMITRDNLMSEMVAKYKNLFVKLNKLSNYNIFIL